MIQIEDLKALSPALRVVAKAIQDGKNDEEISDMLDIPRDRVRSYKQRLVYAVAGKPKPGERRSLDQTIAKCLQDEAVLRTLAKSPKQDDAGDTWLDTPWRAKRQKVELFQDKIGQWYIQGQAKVALPATDWQVSLWLELNELRAVVRDLKAQLEAK